MRNENGIAKYEVVKCLSCDGEGKNKVYDLCPNNWKATGRKPCPICKGIGKDHHKTIGSHIEECYQCKGKGERLEDRYNFNHSFDIGSIPHKVVRTNNSQTFNEAYLGFGMIVSVTDYGQYKTLSDQELIDKIKKDYSSVQYSHFVNDQNIIAKEIIIKCNGSGYSVIPIY